LDSLEAHTEIERGAEEERRIKYGAMQNSKKRKWDSQKYKISIDKFEGRARSCQGTKLTFLVRPIFGSVVFAFHEGEPPAEREILLFALQSGLLREYD
jgi:hypothetical protein